MVSGKIGGRVNGKMGSAVRKAALMACAAWAVAGSASVALAQEQGAAAAQNDGSQLGDIIVTARRTQESLQATPVAVTALTGEMLDRLNPFNQDIRSRPDHNLRARIALDDVAIGRARLGLGVWGDNLTDQRNIDFGIDFGSLGYASASFKKSRSFGVDARITY